MPNKRLIAKQRTKEGVGPVVERDMCPKHNWYHHRLDPCGHCAPEDEGATEHEPKAKAEAKEESTAMAKKEEVKNVTIVREGTQILVPTNLGLEEAAQWLIKKAQEEEQEFKIFEEIDCFPLEGAYAFHQVIADKYGFSLSAPPQSWFDDGKCHQIGLEIGPGVFAQVTWGKIQVPKLAGWLGTEFGKKDGRFTFRIIGVTKHKHKLEIAELARLTRERVKTNSIYRGQAVRIKFPTNEEEDKVGPLDCPKFIQTKDVDPAQLVFPEKLAQLVQTSLFNPIERTAECRKYRIPLKRGILLEGTYGTGKTLTAYVAAKKCIENGWTFLYLDTVSQLSQAIQFAQHYQPCVIFAEDIDRVTSDDRDAEMDQILNTIDGIDTKAAETIVVLTTNDVAAINVAMLRPGRLDAVISVLPPDAEAAIRLVRLYARGLIDADANLNEVGKMLDGKIPAIIREVVERSKLAALSHARQDQELRLTAADLEIAAESMLRHLDLLKEEEEDERSEAEKAADVLGRHVVAAFEMASGHRLPEVRPNGKGKELPASGA